MFLLSVSYSKINPFTEKPSTPASQLAIILINEPKRGGVLVFFEGHNFS